MIHQDQTTDVTVEITTQAGNWPGEQQLQELADTAIAAAVDTGNIALPANSEVSLVFSNDAEVQKINARWRAIDRPTNVLSFPQFDTIPNSGVTDAPVLLGDIILASETVTGEAAAAGISSEDHISHLIVHGFLHLLGYDHENDTVADEMESLETAALAQIGISNPYRTW